jgi:hypothetical protein
MAAEVTPIIMIAHTERISRLELKRTQRQRLSKDCSDDNVFELSFGRKFQKSYFPAGWIEEFDEGAVMPVFVLPRFPTALFRVFEEPGVPAGPRLLPVVPWLFALLAFVPGAPPVPFTVAPLLSVVPPDVPPDDELGEPPAELPPAPAAPPAEPPPAEPPPPPPPPAAFAKVEPKAKQSTRARIDFVMVFLLKLTIVFTILGSFEGRHHDGKSVEKLGGRSAKMDPHSATVVVLACFDP